MARNAPEAGLLFINIFEIFRTTFIIFNGFMHLLLMLHTVSYPTHNSNSRHIFNTFIYSFIQTQNQTNPLITSGQMNCCERASMLAVHCSLFVPNKIYNNYNIFSKIIVHGIFSKLLFLLMESINSITNTI